MYRHNHIRTDRVVEDLQSLKTPLFSIYASIWKYSDDDGGEIAQEHVNQEYTSDENNELVPG